MLRRCPSFALVVSAAWWAVAPARAEPDRPAPVRPVRVEMGLGGTMVAERFQPFVVWLAGGDKPLSGVAELTIDQDVTQRVRVSAPFSVEPGKQTPVEFLVALPAFADGFRLRLEAGAFREEWDSRLQAMGSPLAWSGRVAVEPLVVTIGECSSRWIEQDRAAPETTPPVGEVPGSGILPMPGTSPKVFTFEDLARVGVAAGAMPTSWLGYDAATLVVLASDFDRGAAMDPRAPAALRDWLHQGGTLVVLADRPGQEWRRFLAEGEEAPVELEELGPIDLRPVDFASAWPQGEGPARLPEMVESAMGRACVVTPAGARRGWLPIWQAPGAGGSPARSLAAIGPAGLGRLVVLGVDPRRMMGSVTSAGGSAIWWRLLSHPLRRAFRDEGVETTSAHLSTGLSTSGRTARAQQALGALLDEDLRSHRLAPGVGPLLVLGGIGLAMIALVWIVDSRLARRREFAVGAVLSTIGWIGLFSLVGGLAPRLMRAQEHAVFRDEVYDVVQRGDGSRVGWRTGTLGVFAGRSSTFRWSDPAPGVCARGVSPMGGWERSRVGLADLPLDLRWQEGSSRRGMGAGPIPMSVWSYRALLDRTPALEGDALPPVRVIPGEAGGEIRVEGVPGDAELVGRALVRWPGALDQVYASERVGVGAYVLHPRQEFDDVRASNPIPALRLEGVDERTWAMERRSAGGEGCVLVLFEWTGRGTTRLQSPPGVVVESRVVWRTSVEPRGGER